MMFHVAMWRERMRDALKTTIDGGEYSLPGTRDEINDAELPKGIGTPLADAAARADHLLTEVIELFAIIGDKQIKWFSQVSTQESLLRNSYTHPRRHMYDYLTENGESEQARKLVEDGLRELREMSASDYVMEVLTEVK
ncbi:MAG TPA: hypothetical protein VKE27_07405 [Candidatus Dormibacteraeota bacterium]|nr:hypothetical protein [Candidatus Dormibacteraeota bacterium]